MNETTRQILEERARKLASPRRDAESDPSQGFDVLCFSLGAERYGFTALSVREVSPLKELSPIPCTPPFVSGMINLRGQIITVIDVRPLFGLPRDGLLERQHIVVLRSGESEAGVVADAIDGIRSIGQEALQSAVPTFDGLRLELIHGVTSDGLVVLDASKLLSHPLIAVREEVPAVPRALERKPQANTTT